jgi:hypothetical protein
LLSWLVSTDFGTCSYQCFCPTLRLFPCICWSVVVHTLYHVSVCTVLLPVLGILILRVLLLAYCFYFQFSIGGSNRNLNILNVWLVRSRMKSSSITATNGLKTKAEATPQRHMHAYYPADSRFSSLYVSGCVPHRTNSSNRNEKQKACYFTLIILLYTSCVFF